MNQTAHALTVPSLYQNDFPSTVSVQCSRPWHRDTNHVSVSWMFSWCRWTARLRRNWSSRWWVTTSSSGRERTASSATASSVPYLWPSRWRSPTPPTAPSYRRSVRTSCARIQVEISHTTNSAILQRHPTAPSYSAILQRPILLGLALVHRARP